MLAQEEARLLDHSFIGTEHILLGLVHEGEGVAARALESLGISLDAVREKVKEKVKESGPAVSGPVGSRPFTPRSKKVLELSLREALELGHRGIDTEHVLLGILREGEGVAAQVLQSLGADLPRVRQQVVQLLSGYQGRYPATAPARGPASRETPGAGEDVTAGPGRELLRRLERPATSQAGLIPPGEADGPRCPRCRAGLVGNLRYATLRARPLVHRAGAGATAGRGGAGDVGGAGTVSPGGAPTGGTAAGTTGGASEPPRVPAGEDAGPTFEVVVLYCGRCGAALANMR